MAEFKENVAKGALIAVVIVLILGEGSNYLFQKTTPTYTIVTDKTSYVVGDTIRWTASGLIKGESYTVGADLNGNILQTGSFTATASTVTGSYNVGSNAVGATEFIIGQPTSSGAVEILASTPISTNTISIVTDRTSYVVGDTIRWTASGLTIGGSYFVGAELNNSVLQSGSFNATASNMAGYYNVGSNAVGSTSFIIGQAISSGAIAILASAPITLSP